MVPRYGNVAECGRKFRVNFGKRVAPSASYVKKLNCRIWVIENLVVYIENPMHPKCRCLCGF